MKTLIKVLLLGVLVAVIAIGGYLLWKGHGKKGDNAQASPEQEAKVLKEAPVPVRVVKAVRGDLPLRLSFSGQSDCWEKATVKAETSGRVEKILKKVGDRVSKGELVVLLDPRERKLELEEAKAEHLKALADYITTFKLIKLNQRLITEEDKRRLAQERKKYEEVVARYRAGACSLEELKKAEERLLEVMIETGALQEQVRKATKGLTNAEIALRKAELELEKTKVRAPFSGIIGDIKVSPGMEVSSGAELFRLVNPSSLYIKAFVLESEVGKVRRGMSARVRFLAFPDRFFRAEVFAISPELDPEHKTATVFLKILNPSPLLKPGMSCDVEIEYRVVKNVVKVPRKAIIVRSGRPLVFVVKNGIALWRYIELGAQNDEEAEVKSGVAPGEDVVVEGQLTLAHQSKVKILK